jgi:DNA-binding LacI/PurR family transcriptional regulator
MSPKNKQTIATPTLEDIAQMVGVSKMTVSRALRGTGRISADTVAKVKSAAQNLGYRPNPMVQTLMANVRKKSTEQSSNIAWVFSHQKGEKLPPPLIEVEKGAELRAREMGYELSHFYINENDYTTQSILRILKARNIRGVIINPMKTGGTLDHFPWDEFAVATIGRSLLKPAIHYIMAHYYHSMQRILDELRMRGYRRIGLLIHSPSWEIRADHSTAMVFQHHCLNEGIDPTLAYPNCTHWKYEDYQDWYQQYKPDAIIGDYTERNDSLMESEIPSKAIGYATLSWKANSAQCSGIKLPFREMGAAAIDMVVAQIHRNERGIPASPKAMLLEGEWIEGKTLRPRQVIAGASGMART